MGRGRSYQSPISSASTAPAARWKSGSDSGSGRPSGIGTWWSKPVLVDVERRRQVEDGLAVLDGHDPAGGERAAVADAVDLVEDRHRRVAGAQEVGVQRVDRPVGARRAGRGDQRLAGHLAAEHPLAVLVAG